MNPNKQRLCNVWDWKMTYKFHHKHKSISLHSLAMLLTFVGKHDLIYLSFRCICKDQMKEMNIDVIPVRRYYRPKKSDMPSNEVNCSVLPLHVMPHQVFFFRKSPPIRF